MVAEDPLKLARLIQRFPWGQDGFPDAPPDPLDRENRVERWISERLAARGFENAALALHARIQSIIDEVQQDLPADEPLRLFYRSDVSHLLKTPKSVLDKMARDWDPAGGGVPKISFDNFETAMDDLARFRIILNFLSDVKQVCSRLERPYRYEIDDGTLSQTQRDLRSEFSLNNHLVADLIDLPPEDRKTGERCRKAVFSPRAKPEIKIEVQIQTMLQEAWDKKDHFLIYEPRRRGEAIDPGHKIQSYAMSELLYVADFTFDNLLTAARGRRRTATA